MNSSALLCIWFLFVFQFPTLLCLIFLACLFAFQFFCWRLLFVIFSNLTMIMKVVLDANLKLHVLLWLCLNFLVRHWWSTSHFFCEFAILLCYGVRMLNNYCVNDIILWIYVSYRFLRVESMEAPQFKIIQLNMIGFDFILSQTLTKLTHELTALSNSSYSLKWQWKHRQQQWAILLPEPHQNQEQLPHNHPRLHPSAKEEFSKKNVGIFYS